MIEPRAILKGMFEAAVEAADPARIIDGWLPQRPKGRVIVVGAGKGAAQLARAFERAWDGPLEGLVVTRYGYEVPCEHLEVIQAAHPVPDDNGLMASKRLLQLVQDLSADDLVVALICGGASSLLPSPPDGISLADEQAMNESLLASGAPISDMNVIRKHVSNIKGGRLAKAAYPAQVVSLIVSDIPGDIAAYVGSGPTIADESNREKALTIIRQYGMDLPASIMAHLESSAADAPRPDEECFARNEVHVIASAGQSLKAAADWAADKGYDAHILSDSIEGESRHIGQMHGALAREVALKDQPFAKPAILLSGGETTVTLSNAGLGLGKGGRNSEGALALALDIAGQGSIHALFADTDGIDGSENNAGAFVDGSTVARLREISEDARDYLDRNDAWSAFEVINDLFVTGPTGTNVNDFRAILIED
ncbi:MAG: glycerate kinase [Cohaesibacter sp.]|nr:glycerate kinase [Cohaesibacter sp.]MCV6602010.1 glycerate kinase [Cohaesibacter sp.]